jgi:hypothetical protein
MGVWASKAITAEAQLTLARAELEELRAYKAHAQAALSAGAEKREALVAAIHWIVTESPWFNVIARTWFARYTDSTPDGVAAECVRAYRVSQGVPPAES